MSTRITDEYLRKIIRTLKQSAVKHRGDTRPGKPRAMRDRKRFPERHHNARTAFRATSESLPAAPVTAIFMPLLVINDRKSKTSKLAGKKWRATSARHLKLRYRPVRRGLVVVVN